MSYYNINILFFFFIQILQLPVIKSYLILNFKKYINQSLPQSDTALNLDNYYEMEQFLFTYYIAYLEIGDPLQKVELGLFFNDYSLKMYEEYCLTNFTFFPELSNSFIELEESSYDEEGDYSYKYNQVKVSDLINFHIYNNNKIENNIVNFSFVYEKTNMSASSIKNSNEKPCFHLGLNFRCVTDYFCINFMSSLKYNKIIDSYNINIIYNENKNYDGSIFIGTDSNITKYHDLFKNKELIEDSSYKKNADAFETQFDEVYYYLNNEKVKAMGYIKDRAEFRFDFNYIIGTKYFYTLIKEDYFNKSQKLCTENLVMKKYRMFVCDKSLNTDNFPTIYFYNNDYNYTFEFSSKELFVTKGDKKYFIIIFDTFIIDTWKIGKIFMEKNYFNFNFDKKQVGFYKPTKTEVENNSFNFGKNFYIIIYIVSLIIIGGLCYYLGAKLYRKIRKKRMNELEDLIEDEETGIN